MLHPALAGKITNQTTRQFLNYELKSNIGDHYFENQQLISIS